ncbi:hypothetical protein TNCT_717491 [Trichonephila clavata]|uniref:Uncharacterized protein n=1 Tax=Trichonephila clavata TaxID=2740835 RepID=A0A8X6KHI4_TRICU|nr:hypothetical protein TNCT_717491 [Trichonephila clavata]
MGGSKTSSKKIQVVYTPKNAHNTILSTILKHWNFWQSFLPKGLQVDRQSFWPKRAPRRLAESLVKQGPDQGPAATGQSQGPSPTEPLAESKPGYGRNWTESGTKSCGTTGRVQTRDQIDEGTESKDKAQRDPGGYTRP